MVTVTNGGLALRRETSTGEPHRAQFTPHAGPRAFI